MRVRAGDNKQTIVLEIEKLTDEITVGRDKQEAAADARVTFGSTLTREQVDALSDNPEEMRRQLLDMGGPGAVIRVDSFEGGDLPPKSQIKSIHITRDTFAAENHNAGAIFVEIITQPGIGPLRGGGRVRPARRRAERPQSVHAGQGTRAHGELRHDLRRLDRAAEELVFGVGRRDDVLRDAEPERRAAERRACGSAEPADPPRPRQPVRAVRRCDHARSDAADGVLPEYGTPPAISASARYDLPERAFATEDTSHTFRIQEAGPLGRRFFINTRLNVNRVAQRTARGARSAHDPRQRRVHERRRADRGRHATPQLVNFASDLDYVRGIHSVRGGITLDGGWTRSDMTSNYLGTYTFESLAAFDARQPTSYTRRLGDPVIEYGDLRGGFYVQDDIRVQTEPDVEPRRALRAADARPRSRGHRTSVRRDLGAVQERQDDAACEHRDFLRLAGPGHLRADAQSRRRPPAGTQHPQSALSQSRRRRRSCRPSIATC